MTHNHQTFNQLPGVAIGIVNWLSPICTLTLLLSSYCCCFTYFQAYIWYDLIWYVPYALWAFHPSIHYTFLKYLENIYVLRKTWVSILKISHTSWYSLFLHHQRIMAIRTYPDMLIAIALVIIPVWRHKKAMMENYQHTKSPGLHILVSPCTQTHNKVSGKSPACRKLDVNDSFITIVPHVTATHAHLFITFTK